LPSNPQIPIADEGRGTILLYSGVEDILIQNINTLFIELTMLTINMSICHLDELYTILPMCKQMTQIQP